MSKLFIILSFISLWWPQNNKTLSETKCQTIIKFLNYTTWPENIESNKKEINIYIATSDEEYIEMKNYFDQVLYENKTFIVSKLDNQTDISNASIIYVSSNSEIDIDILHAKLKNKPILTLTSDKKLIVNGFMFYFNNEKEEVEYLFNKIAIIESGLMIKSTLLKSEHDYRVQ